MLGLLGVAELNVMQLPGLLYFLERFIYLVELIMLLYDNCLNFSWPILSMPELLPSVEGGCVDHGFRLTMVLLYALHQ